MLAGSVAAVYWLQPLTPIRNLDFWLPTASLALAIWVWALTRPAAGPAASHPAEQRATATTGLVIAGLIVAIGLTRYLGPVCCVTPSRPPGILPVLGGVVLVAAMT